MKKTLALILSVFMIAGTVCSCGKPMTQKDDPANTDQNNTDPTAAPSEKTDQSPEGSYDQPESTACEKVEMAIQKITFGSYPQSEVTDTALKATLTARAGALPTKTDPKSWTSFKYYYKYKENSTDKTERDYMWYIDITEEGERYRGIFFASYRPTYVLRSSAAGTSYQDDNGYLTGTVYWFKYEPISWTVLKENADGASLILCDSILDCQEFDYNDSDGTYHNDYSRSSIRDWLNASFLNTAFTADEKSKILDTTVDNSVASTGHLQNPNACADTTDKVFLLSYMEAVNDQYGLEVKEARIKEGTAYAKAQGLYVEADGGNSWWLRSPSPDPIVAIFKVRGVMNTGAVDSYINANFTYRGVVPALWVKL